MIDPELAAMIDLLPKIDLVDPVAARRAFEEILVAIRSTSPASRRSTSTTAWCREPTATRTCRCVSIGPKGWRRGRASRAS